MKQVLFSCLLLGALLFSGCGLAQTSDKAKTETKSKAAKTPKAPKAPKAPKVPEEPKKETYTGEYSSSKGVMTPLSCYCSDGGTLSVSEDEKIKVCFDNMKERPENCQQLTVTGQFQTIANDPDENSPCPKGTMKVFVVESFKCN